MSHAPSPLKLTLLDLGGSLISTGIFYAFDLLNTKVTIMVLGANTAYVTWRRFVVRH